MNSAFKIQTSDKYINYTTNSVTRPIFQIQTRNPYNYIIGDKVYNLNCPGSNNMGLEISIGSLSFVLTNNNLPITFTGIIPIKIDPISIPFNGNLFVILNVYDYNRSNTPIYYQQFQPLTSFSSNNNFLPVLFYNLAFQFTDNPINYISTLPRIYIFKMQLQSIIKITNQLSINYLDPNNTSTGMFFNIIGQQQSSNKYIHV